jgi:hypothetical protein
MIGRIIGAIAGAKAAEKSRSMGGATGALVGAVAEPLVRKVGFRVLRRVGPIGWIAAAAGGYALKRYSDRQDAGKPKVRPSAT